MDAVLIKSLLEEYFFSKVTETDQQGPLRNFLFALDGAEGRLHGAEGLLRARVAARLVRVQPQREREVPLAARLARRVRRHAELAPRVRAAQRLRHQLVDRGRARVDRSVRCRWPGGGGAAAASGSGGGTGRALGSLPLALAVQLLGRPREQRLLLRRRRLARRLMRCLLRCPLRRLRRRPSRLALLTIAAP